MLDPKYLVVSTTTGAYRRESIHPIPTEGEAVCVEAVGPHRRPRHQAPEGVPGAPGQCGADSHGGLFSQTHGTPDGLHLPHPAPLPVRAQFLLTCMPPRQSLLGALPNLQGPALDPLLFPSN